MDTKKSGRKKILAGYIQQNSDTNIIFAKEKYINTPSRQPDCDYQYYGYSTLKIKGDIFRSIKGMIKAYESHPGDYSYEKAKPVKVRVTIEISVKRKNNERGLK